MSKRLVIIDDDAISNKLTELVIMRHFPETEVVAFEHPKKGLDFLEGIVANDIPVKKTVLLLDINMPGLSGWDILDRLDVQRAAVASRLKIFMLSSSIVETDRTKAAEYALVSGYFEKPLVSNNFKHLLWEQ